MNRIIYGTCSLCGGTVSTLHVYHSINLPTLTCESCGATKAIGPITQMTPAPAPRTVYYIGDTMTHKGRVKP